MAVLSSLTQLSPRVASGYDAILVGCSERLLLSPAFRAHVQPLAPHARLIAMLPAPQPEAGARAATLGFAGLVARGARAFPRSALTRLVEAALRARAGRQGALASAALTPRQRQVVDLIAQGAKDPEIARLLRISQSTTHKHVQSALRRLKARTRSQLVAAAR